MLSCLFITDILDHCNALHCHKSELKNIFIVNSREEGHTLHMREDQNQVRGVVVTLEGYFWLRQEFQKCLCSSVQFSAVCWHIYWLVLWTLRLEIACLSLKLHIPIPGQLNGIATNVYLDNLVPKQNHHYIILCMYIVIVTLIVDTFTVLKLY